MQQLNCKSKSFLPLFSQNLDLSQAGKLKPEYWWLSSVISGSGHSGATSGAVFIFTCCSAALCVQIHFFTADIRQGEWWSITTLIFFIVCLCGCECSSVCCTWSFLHLISLPISNGKSQLRKKNSLKNQQPWLQVCSSSQLITRTSPRVPSEYHGYLFCRDWAFCPT